MSIVLPTGWNTFSGGGVEPDLCAEPQTCTEPPCGPIPPITIIPTTTVTALDCTNGVFDIPLQVTGGVPAFTWISSEGFLEIIDTRNVILHIDESVTLGGHVPIGVTLHNPCSLPAYVYRGKASFYNNSGCNHTNACDGHSVMFNCRGEFIGGVDLGIQTPTCSDAIESGLLGTFDPDTDVMDYRNCLGVQDDSKYPLICFNNTFPASCPDLPPKNCDGYNDMPLATIYPTGGVCTDTPTMTDVGAAGSLLAGVHTGEGSICDVRHPDLKALGCSPCTLIGGQDILVDAEDAAGTHALLLVHVNI